MPVNKRVHFLFLALISKINGLIQNDWDTLAQETTIRYFNPSKFTGEEEDLWHDLGEEISCVVNKDLTVDLKLPDDFNLHVGIKAYTHGFSADVSGATVYSKAWIIAHNVSVILVDWKSLAFFGQITDWGSYSYDSAARNSIDIGEYLGHCLSALITSKGLDPALLHLTGHSLGAHLMGKAARTFRELNGETIGRISGLDPAGPRFIDGPVMAAIPELYANRLSHESASFVDVIHTDGSFIPAAIWVPPRLGDLNQLGHMDFYPVGGEEQPGCTLGGPDALPFSVCSHNRAMYYFFHSILNTDLFPSQICSNVTNCNQHEVASENILAYMGDASQNYFMNERQLFFVDVQDEHWDWKSHY